MHYLYKDLKDTFIPYLLVKEYNGIVTISSWEEKPLKAIRARQTIISNKSYLDRYNLVIIYSSKEPITESKLLTTHPEYFV